MEEVCLSQTPPADLETKPLVKDGATAESIDGSLPAQYDTLARKFRPLELARDIQSAVEALALQTDSQASTATNLAEVVPDLPTLSCVPKPHESKLTSTVFLCAQGSEKYRAVEDLSALPRNSGHMNFARSSVRTGVVESILEDEVQSMSRYAAITSVMA